MSCSLQVFSKTQKCISKFLVQNSEAQGSAQRLRKLDKTIKKMRKFPKTSLNVLNFSQTSTRGTLIFYSSLETNVASIPPKFKITRPSVDSIWSCRAGEEIRVDYPEMTQGIFSETGVGHRGTRDDLFRAHACTQGLLSYPWVKPWDRNKWYLAPALGP